MKIIAMGLPILLMAGAITPAFADSSLPGFAAEVLGNRVVEGRALKKEPVNAIKAGEFTIILERTTLGEIAGKFGGEIQQRGDAGDSTNWLCYVVPGASPTVITFASGEIGGDEHAVTVATSETSVTGAIEGCTVAPPALTGLDFGVPGLGRSVKEVTRTIGAEKPDRANRLKYNSTSSTADGSVLQTLTFRLQDGKVTGVAVTQASTD